MPLALPYSASVLPHSKTQSPTSFPKASSALRHASPHGNVHRTSARHASPHGSSHLGRHRIAAAPSPHSRGSHHSPVHKHGSFHGSPIQHGHNHAHLHQDALPHTADAEREAYLVGYQEACNDLLRDRRLLALGIPSEPHWTLSARSTREILLGYRDRPISELLDAQRLPARGGPLDKDMYEYYDPYGFQHYLSSFGVEQSLRDPYVKGFAQGFSLGWEQHRRDAKVDFDHHHGHPHHETHASHPGLNHIRPNGVHQHGGHHVHVPRIAHRSAWHGPHAPHHPGAPHHGMHVRPALAHAHPHAVHHPGAYGLPSAVHHLTPPHGAHPVGVPPHSGDHQFGHFKEAPF